MVMDRLNGLILMSSCWG